MPLYTNTNIIQGTLEHILLYDQVHLTFITPNILAVNKYSHLFDVQIQVLVYF